MNKAAIKRFAIEARNKLRNSVTDKAGMLGITPEECSGPVTTGPDFKVYQTAAGTEVTLNKSQCELRKKLVDKIVERGFDAVVEEVAYTWFNRICAIRFMEVNDYLPSRVRVLSSEKKSTVSGLVKNEPDLVTMAPDVDLPFTEEERENGGTILLGIKEHRDSFTVEGLTDQQIVKYQKDFWSTLNDRNKVSKNILLNHHVRPVAVGEKRILRIDVPAADRHDKPVYIGTDPMKGTYKRDYEGDFLCTEEAVRAMFADQRDVSGDVEVLDEFGLDVLNQDTIKGYRIIFEQLHSGHPWNALENDEFLMKLRAAAKNKNGTLSPTIAGLLFFGEAYHITEIFPNYFLDYREECDDKAVRWLFRTHSNEGDWSGNIYDFFCKVRTRMDDDVAVPFANRRDGYRVDRVDVHDALEEALANALAHANYYGRRGILVVKKGKELSISNPGTIRVTKEEFYAGGNSDPRNPNILKMFGFVNVGERAGSGVDKIMTAWAEQNWKKPVFDFSERNDRVTLKLEVGQVVYIPGAADIRNENTNQAKAMAVSKEDKILEYIRQNGSISSQKAADVGGYKSKTGARKLLDKMIEKGLITKIGNGPATKYVI